MIFRTLGRTGLQVSQLGFGAMRLPMIGSGGEMKVDRDRAIPMIHRAYAAGVNYIDTAVGYCEKDSQRVVGESLEGWHNRVIVSTKNPYFGTDERVWRQNLEDSLERLRVEYIDIYNLHGISWKIYTENIEPRVWKWITAARDEGLIRHICCSFHDTNEALRKIIDAGRFASITLQYNMLDRKLEDGIAYAHEKGIGVAVMGPVGGGRLAEPSGVMESVIRGKSRIPEIALRFVLANPYVSIALSGMSTMEQVEENAAIAGDPAPLSPEFLEEMKIHLSRLRAMADLYCTGCGYCLPCPQGVSIPRIFELYNQAKIYDIRKTSQETYSQIGKVPWEPGKTADSCTECGICETKCPQRIPIREQLAESHRMLG
ncbi:MAG: aldo/keto reductase [Candidatus Latescibacterota bacterium]